MSDQSSQNPISQSSHTHESAQARKQRIEKKKMIRKQKVKERKRETIEIGEEKPLTKEQKKQLQKQKNRIAAQVSRDNRKKYIKDLEIKIQQLQTQIEQQLCSRCQASVAEPPSQDFFAPDDMMEQPQSIFLRRSPSTDSLNSIGNYFLIVMITIAVFSFTGSVLVGDGSLPKQTRILHPIAPYGDLTQNTIPREQIIFEKQNQAGLIEIGKHIDEGQNLDEGPKQQCFYDFLKMNVPEVGLYGNKFHDKSIILCKNPEVFPKIHKESESSTSLLGQELTLFMSGPQIKELENDVGIASSFYSLEGIYKMQLEIKTLQKVFGTNCLS